MILARTPPAGVGIKGFAGLTRASGFSRAAFGIVRVRTDGRRLFVFTDSGQADLKEAYAYEVTPAGATPTPVHKA